MKVFKAIAYTATGLLIVPFVNIPPLGVSAEMKQPPIKTVVSSSQTSTAKVGKTVENSIVPPRELTSKELLFEQAGIPESEWVAADTLIGLESSWRPDSVNPSSGACGLPQALPCAKMGCSLSDQLCQIKWMYSYVQSRQGYGNFNNALSFWYAQDPHWY